MGNFPAVLLAVDGPGRVEVVFVDRYRCAARMYNGFPCPEPSPSFGDQLLLH